VDRPVRHRREDQRLINRRQQGDLGEASAIEWLTRMGAIVLIPLGHSPDYDLVGEIDGRLLRIQVKTTTYQRETSSGGLRWNVALATNGGNQSWSGVAKTFDPGRCDFLFVLTGDGRRWLIPTRLVEGHRGIGLGGAKYSEFELEPAAPITNVVYGDQDPRSKMGDTSRGSADVGESGETVNLVPQAEWVRIPPPPSSLCLDDVGGDGNGDTTRFEHRVGRSGHAILRPKRQTTIPKRPFIEAGLKVGDRMRVRAEGEGRVVFQRIEPASVPRATLFEN
jgi:hypothetical protein